MKLSLSRMSKITGSFSAQILSSVFTVVLSIYAARELSPEKFGIFALLFTSYTLVLGLLRGFTTEVLIYNHSSSMNSVRTEAISGSTNALRLLSAAIVLIALLAGFFIQNYHLELIIFGLTLPLMLFRDHERLVLTMEGRSGAAFLIDSVAITSLVIFVLIRPLPHVGPLMSILLIWLFSSLLTALFATFFTRVPLRIESGMDWIRETWRDGRFYAGDFLSSNGITLSATYVVALIAGLPASGALRAAQVLLTPILLVLRGFMVAIAPTTRRLVTQGRRKDLMTVSLLYATSSVFTCLLVLVAGSVLPPASFQLILGDSAEMGLKVLPWAAIATAMVGVVGGANLGLRALGRIRTTFWAKVIAFPVGITSVIIGAVLGGAAGSQIGRIVTQGVIGAQTWTAYIKSYPNSQNRTRGH